MNKKLQSSENIFGKTKKISEIGQDQKTLIPVFV